MAVIKHEVPLHGQVNANSCWNASAMMIWFYWQRSTGFAGPMNSLEEAFARSKTAGLYPVEFVRLAENVGLKAVHYKYPLLAADVASLLEKHGPLWCAGYWWGTNDGHVIVATGVNGSLMSFNDPAPQGKGSYIKKSVGVFNAQLAQNVSGCLMYKDPGRY